MNIKKFMTSSVGRSVGEWLAEWVTISDSIVYIVTFGNLKPHNAFRIMAAINRLSIGDRIATLTKQRAARKRQWIAEGEAGISKHDDIPLEDVKHKLQEADELLNILARIKNPQIVVRGDEDKI